MDPEQGVGYTLSTTERLDPLTTLNVSWGVGRKRGADGEDSATIHVSRRVKSWDGSVSAEVSEPSVHLGIVPTIGTLD